MSDHASGAESTRNLAGQRPASDKHFETPAWVGPDRHPERREPRQTSRIPAQPSPVHDLIAPALRSPRPDILEHGTWKRSSPGRRVAGLLLLVALVATVGFGLVAAESRSNEDLVVAIVAAMLTTALWAMMATSKPMEVDLRGPLLTVRHDGIEETFNLANPFQRVEIRGSLGSPTWTLVIGRENGTEVAIGSRTVPPAEMHPVVMYHRAKADSRRDDRNRRFST
jgi:hypothetical protein